MNLSIIPVGPLQANCYILDDSKTCVVIDPGADAQKIIGKLRELAVSPAYILLTHGHPDHTGAVNALKAQYPDCIVAINQNDEEFTRQEGKGILRNFAGTVPIDRYVSEGDIIKAGALELAVIETPGHSRGGVVYRCEDSLFTGDTLFAGDCGRTDLHGGNWPVMQASLRKLRELDGDFRVFPGHGAHSMLSRERIHNEYMRDA